MDRVVLQHWTGPLNDLVCGSFASIEAYAKRVGADYHLLRGDVFRKGLSAACQKMHMLSERWDRYDLLVMVDADMFALTDEDVFEVPGVGMTTEYQRDIFKRFRRRLPHLASGEHPFWGGAIWKLTRGMRRTFRSLLPNLKTEEFSQRGNFEDEGMMHRLATLADFRDPAGLPERWCWSSYKPGREGAAMLHVRQKWAMDTPRKEGDKVENYRRLVACGLI